MKLLRAPVRRAGWGLADQGLSSLANLLAGLLVARSGTVAEFGVYALAFGGYTIALNLSRAVATEPLAVRYAGDRTPAWRDAVRAGTATALAAGTVAAVAGLAIAAVPGLPGRSVLLAFAVAMPAALLQDAWRWAFFAVGDGRGAFVNDLIWLIATVVFVTGLYVAGWAGPATLVLSWGAGALVAAVAGRVQTGLSPRLRLVRPWLREHRDLVPKYVAEMLLLSGTVQVYLLGITAVAGIAAVSGIRGGWILLGPVNVLNQGIRAIAVPEVARALRRSRRRLWLTAGAISAVVAAGGLCWGGLLLLLPDSAGDRLLGPAVWAAAGPVLLPVVLLQVFGAANAGAFAVLRATAAAARGLRVRVASSVLLVTGGIGGGALAGATGAAWGLAGAAAFTLLLWWWQASRA